MFFLKSQPSSQMIDGYASIHGVAAEAIAEGLATMRRASLMIRRLESYFADHGISQLRLLILIVIDREPYHRTLTVGEITDRLDVAGPVIARTLRTLLEDGLVSIERDTNDARTKHISLTATACETLHALLPGYFAIITEEMEKPL
jgi:DNA-binding MarR family transcriptional regulator